MRCICDVLGIQLLYQTRAWPLLHAQLSPFLLRSCVKKKLQGFSRCTRLASYLIFPQLVWGRNFSLKSVLVRIWLNCCIKDRCVVYPRAHRQLVSAVQSLTHCLAYCIIGGNFRRNQVLENWREHFCHQRYGKKQQQPKKHSFCRTFKFDSVIPYFGRY